MICTLDVETINISQGIQIPFAISFAYKKNNITHCNHYLIDHQLLLTNTNSAILKMWTEFYCHLKSLNLSKRLVIYSHNFGSFDGYFIAPSLYNYAESHKLVNMLIDDKNKFISVTYNYSVLRDVNSMEQQLSKDGVSEEEALKSEKYKWTFLDSCRLFPSSLENLCKMFNVKGKISKYNPEWNGISLLSNNVELEKFIEYSKQDSICLLEALLKAQEVYQHEYDVNITKAVSTPSLSLLIFRKKFLKV